MVRASWCIEVCVAEAFVSVVSSALHANLTKNHQTCLCCNISLYHPHNRPWVNQETVANYRTAQKNGTRSKQQHKENIQQWHRLSIQHRIRKRLCSTSSKTTLQSKTNKTTLKTIQKQPVYNHIRRGNQLNIYKNTSSTFSKTINKSADQEHKMLQGDQTFAHPHPKTHKEQQQDQSSLHLDTSARAKHFYTTKHPNYCEATNITYTKTIYRLYIPLAHKKNTTTTNSTSTSEKFQLQKQLQTKHSRTIIEIQHILNLCRTSNTEQSQILPAVTHSRTTYYKFTVPTPKLHHKTISTASTATRTLYTATVCSNRNINSIQWTTQCISTSNKPFNINQQ